MPGAAIIANWLTTSEWFSGVPSLCCESLAWPTFSGESLVLAVVSPERLVGGFLFGESLSVPSLSVEYLRRCSFASESLVVPFFGGEIVTWALVVDEVVRSPAVSGESVVQFGWLDGEFVVSPSWEAESVVVSILDNETVITSNRECEC